MTVTIFANVLVIGCVDSGSLNSYGISVNLIIYGGFNFYSSAPGLRQPIVRAGDYTLPDIIIHRDVRVSGLHLA